MDTVIPALQSVGHAIHLTLVEIALQDATWGFVTGFLAATGIFAVITSENPSHLPILLTRSEYASFNQVAPRSEDGRFTASYTAFEREYNRVRIVFYLALFAFLVVVAIALLRY